jgi:hypothetical protein
MLCGPLDPVFVRRVAEGLELDSDRIELIEKQINREWTRIEANLNDVNEREQRSTDRTLHHIAMALRAGVQSGAAVDRMYGEALSTALAVQTPRLFALRAVFYQRIARSSK